MHINPYGSDKASLAVGLVNADPFTDPPAMGELLRHYKTTRPEVDAQETAELLAWAAKLRVVFEATDLDERIETLNLLLGEAAIQPTIARHEGEMTPHLHYSLDTDSTVKRVKARTATGLAHVVCASGGGRLGCCARDGCTTVFIDTSRNGRRRFCSTQCANRIYVADHRARRRT
ncbi:CGNR zinc finger domain-containing protein [Allokutzneria multivorans]|uniref:CGNR zinc finger domain-containing protein n=1 Tax=Allokutzneria multivorans TaxID=1142134 RepID=A0ABP7U2Q3_9PSEU